jgi:hypothetical protein
MIDRVMTDHDQRTDAGTLFAGVCALTVAWLLMELQVPPPPGPQLPPGFDPGPPPDAVDEPPPK